MPNKLENEKLSKKKLNKSILWLLEPENRTDKKPWEDSDDEREPPAKRQRTR